MSAKTSLSGAGRIGFWLGSAALFGKISPCEFFDGNCFVLRSQIQRIFKFFGGGGEPGKVIDKIVGSRTHHSTDKTPEYRVVVNTEMFALWTKAGLKGTRQAPEVDVKGKGKEVGDDNDDLDNSHQNAEPAPDIDAESDGEEDTSSVPSGKA